MLTIHLHANIKTPTKAAMLAVVSSYSIYETSTILFALVY